MRLTSLAVTLLLAGALVYWFALREPPDDAAMLTAAAITAPAANDQNQPVPVMVLHSQAQPTVDQLVLRGRTVAVRNVSVTAETAGLVTSQPLRKGATVAEGDILCRLDAGARPAQLLEAEARLAEALVEADAATTLSQKGFASETTRTARQAQFEAAQAQVNLVKLDIDRLVIRAPFDGRAGARLVSPGARVKVDDGLVRIDGIDPLSLVFTIPEGVLPLARMGARFEMEVAAFPERRFPGEVRFIAPNVDSATRRILIKGRVPNPDGALLPGMFARVQARLGEHAAVLVPEDAIVTTSEGTFVWRIGAEDKAERVVVELGGRESGRVEIVSGVVAGDRIVTAGTHKVHAGSPVRPVAVAAPAVSPPSPSAAAAPGGDA